jgi:lysophospholipase L1-like esterase
MKTILIYGDSNVWGGDDIVGRYADSQQWATILQNKLGREKFKIVQEGLNGRFAGSLHYELEPYGNGQYCYEPIYRAASPVDIVVLALGTNDLNDRYNRSPDQIAKDILWYENRTKELLDDGETAPKFLYVLPPNFTGKFRDETFNLEKRAVVNDILRDKVENFVEGNNFDLSADGLHLSPKGHAEMAEMVYNRVMELKNERSEIAS